MTTNTNIYKRGWIDTRKNIQEILKADEFLSALFTRHADIPIIKQESVSIISGATQILCGARYLAHNFPQKGLEYIKSLVIGELMSPVLPSSLSLVRDQATSEFKFICNYLIKNDTVYNRSKTGVTWIAHINGLNAAMPEEQKVPVPNIDALTIEDYQHYIIWLVYNMPKTQYMSALLLLITTYIGAAKRGTVTERFLEKVTNGIKDDIGEEVTLDIDVISTVYTNFGYYINAENAKMVFDSWLTDIPEHALRLRLTLEQVSGSGLTAFLITGRAIKKYSDFPWTKMNVLTGGEMNNYVTAVQTVNGNAYYGFNRDLKAAKSTNYSSVAYVAKELLIRIGGEMSLKNYQGWIKKPKSPIITESLIEQYVAKHTASLEEVINSDRSEEGHRALLDVVNNVINAELFM